MKLFNDLNKEEWEIRLTISTAKKLSERLKKTTDVDLMNPQALLIKMADPFFVADLLYLACKDQADGRGVDSEQFGERLAGDVFYEAKEAFLQEYMDFFPDPTVRRNLSTVLEKSNELARQGIEILKSSLNREAEKLLVEMNGTLSSNLPDDVG